MAVATKRLADARLPARGHAHLPGRGRRGGAGRRTAPSTWSSTRPTRSRADYVITESGGIPIPSPGGLKLPVIVGEKGSLLVQAARRAAPPGHGSQPYRPTTRWSPRPRSCAGSTSSGPRRRSTTCGAGSSRRWGTRRRSPTRCCRPTASMELLDELARRAWPASSTPARTPRSRPNIVHGGIEDQHDPRPGRARGRHPHPARARPTTTSRELLDVALGDLAERVEVVRMASDESSASPLDTPLWDTLSRVTQRFYEGSATVPYLTVGATDARFFRRDGHHVVRLRPVQREDDASRTTASMFHGDNERIDVESLGLSIELWEAVARDLLHRDPRPLDRLRPVILRAVDGPSERCAARVSAGTRPVAGSAPRARSAPCRLAIRVTAEWRRRARPRTRSRGRPRIRRPRARACWRASAAWSSTLECQCSPSTKTMSGQLDGHEVDPAEPRAPARARPGAAWPGGRGRG